MSETAVAVRGLTKTFKLPFKRKRIVAVRDLELTVEAGQVYGSLSPKAAQFPDAPSYCKRFAAYELSSCEGRERAAYDRLLQLYKLGEHERVPALISPLKFLENELNIPQAGRIPDRPR